MIYREGRKESSLLCDQGPAGPFYRSKFLGWGSSDSAFFTVDSLCAPRLAIAGAYTSKSGIRGPGDAKISAGSIAWKAAPDATSLVALRTLLPLHYTFIVFFL